MTVSGARQTFLLMRLDIAIAQFMPAKGDPATSLSQVTKVFGTLKERDRSPDVVVFPEAALTGYFLEGGVRDHAMEAESVLEALDKSYQDAPGPDRPLDVVLGFYELADHRIYNSALYAELGGDGPRIRHVHRKVFLPTYGVFQEERFVEAGHSVHAFDTRWGRAAILICEDLFHSISSTLAALSGAQAIFVPSASPARGSEPGRGVPSSVDRWHRVSRGTAEEHGIAVALCQLIGFEGGKGFAGGSVLFGPRGDLLYEAPLWDPAIGQATLELGSLTTARTESPLLADLERTLPRLLQNRESDGAWQPERAKDRAGDDAQTGDDAAQTGDWSLDASVLDMNADLVTEWLTRFLQEEVRTRRGFEKAIVGLSGGVDSALTAALCARALGPENVFGFFLPYRTSSSESLDHGRLVAEQLGIETRLIDISDSVDGYLTEGEPEATDRRRGNVMARMRMIVLFDQAAKLGGLPIGTGNKSERLMGYFTWHADDSPPINPLGDLFKTQVWALARHLGLPSEVVDKPATADLIKGQTDEADLGVSYPEADLILHHLLSGRSGAWLEQAGIEASKVETVRSRLEGTHWKRNLPTVAMLSGTAIGEWYLRPVDY